MNNVLTSLEKKFKVWPPRKTVMVEKIIREVVELVDTDVIDKSISRDANGWPEYFLTKLPVVWPAPLLSVTRKTSMNPGLN